MANDKKKAHKEKAKLTLPEAMQRITELTKERNDALSNNKETQKEVSKIGKEKDKLIGKLEVAEKAAGKVSKDQKDEIENALLTKLAANPLPITKEQKEEIEAALLLELEEKINKAEKDGKKKKTTEPEKVKPFVVSPVINENDRLYTFVNNSGSPHGGYSVDHANRLKAMFKVQKLDILIKEIPEPHATEESAVLIYRTEMVAVEMAIPFVAPKED